jgi:hypothetical protein
VLQYGLITLPRDLGKSLLIGVLVAGLIAALVPPGQFQAVFGGGLVSILVMMAAAVPVYVCATASVPLAAGLIYAGASPGAALAFLIAGPATNAATVATIWRVLGRRSTIAYLLTVAGSAVAAGLLLGGLWPNLADTMPALAEHAHAHETVGAWTHAWAAALLLVLGLSYWQGLRPRHRHSIEQSEDSTMAEPDKATVHLNVSGMTCSHCAGAVERALAEQPGVKHVDVDLAAGRATVSGEGFDEDALVSAVGGLGYKAQRAP